MSTYKGTVVEVSQTQKISDKFQKRIIVVTDKDEKFPQNVPFTFTQDKVSLLDKVSPGSTVEIAYNLRGSEYKGKWYSEIQGWKIDVLESENKSTNHHKPESKEAAFEADGDDSLPF